MSVILSAKAEGKVEEIATYSTERFGWVRIGEYISGLVDEVKSLSPDRPVDRLRTEFTPPIRVRRYKSRVLLWTVRDRQVFVIDIRHHRENWTVEFS